MLIVPLHLQLGEMLVTHRDFFYTVHHEFLVKAKACLENRDPFSVPLIQKGFVEFGINSSTTVSLDPTVLDLGFVERVGIGVMLASFDQATADALFLVGQKGVK